MTAKFPFEVCQVVTDVVEMDVVDSHGVGPGRDGPETEDPSMAAVAVAKLSWNGNLGAAGGRESEQDAPLLFGMAKFSIGEHHVNNNAMDALHEGLQAVMFQFEPGGDVNKVVFEERVGGGGGAVGFIVAGGLSWRAYALLNMCRFGVAFAFCAGEGCGRFSLNASEHEFPQISILLQAPMFAELASAVFELCMPDHKVCGASTCGGVGSNVAELSKSIEARKVVNAKVGRPIGANAGNGSQGLRTCA